MILAFVFQPPRLFKSFRSFEKRLNIAVVIHVCRNVGRTSANYNDRNPKADVVHQKPAAEIYGQEFLLRCLNINSVGCAS